MTTNVLTIYTYPDNSIAHVWHEDHTPDETATFFMQLNADTYPVEAAYFTGSTDQVTIQNGAIYLNNELARDAAWVATVQAEVDATLAQADAQAELVASFATLRQHLPALEVFQVKLLTYRATYGDDPEAFSAADLNTVYADLKAAFAAQPFWFDRLKFFVKRRSIGAGQSLTEVNALLARILAGTESTADKALLWDVAEMLVSQTVAAILGSEKA